MGGQQGEGIESTGEIFSTTLNRMGYHLYSYRHLSSRIKGGHTNNNVRISLDEVRSVADNTNILVAFDQQAIDHKGFSFVNVFSPCVTYNKVNTYDWFKEHLTSVDDIESFDMHDSKNAMNAVMEYDGLLKGIIYHDEHAKSYQGHLGEYQDAPLISREMKLERENFDEMMSEFR